MKNLAHEYFTGQTITIEALRDLRHSVSYTCNVQAYLLTTAIARKA